MIFLLNYFNNNYLDTNSSLSLSSSTCMSLYFKHRTTTYELRYTARPRQFSVRRYFVTNMLEQLKGYITYHKKNLIKRLYYINNFNFFISFNKMFLNAIQIHQEKNCCNINVSIFQIHTIY